MAEEASSKKILVKTVDGIVFEVEPCIVKEMQTVQSYIDNTATITTVIPLPNVCGRELARIIEYYSKHRIIHESGASTHDSKEFDAEFMKALREDELMELILVVNYLNMKKLLDFLCQGIANLIKDKSVEFVRKFFGIVNDFTPEEEAQVRKQNAWAFKGDEH